MTIPSKTVREAAEKVGFDACGIAPVEAMPLFESQLRQWLRDGGGLHYMEQHIAMRAHPGLLVEGARSVVSVLRGYRPSRTMHGRGRVAMYAYGEDYHETIRGMLHAMVAEIKREYPDFEAKVCVDTVPISDKLWAWRAGLGWIGKNTLLVNPDLGSLCNIGELVTTAEVDVYDGPTENRCGDCRACLDACPNHALRPGTVDGVRHTMLHPPLCVSYNTIENRNDSLPEGLLGNGYAFGCDCCQLVCPYNRQAKVCAEISEDRIRELETLKEADEGTFRRVTRHTAMNRIKYAQWTRNLKAFSDN